MGDGEGATINLPLPGDSGKPKWALQSLAVALLLLLVLMLPLERQNAPCTPSRRCCMPRSFGSAPPFLLCRARGHAGGV